MRLVGRKLTERSENKSTDHRNDQKSNFVLCDSAGSEWSALPTGGAKGPSICPGGDVRLERAPNLFVVSRHPRPWTSVPPQRGSKPTISCLAQRDSIAHPGRSSVFGRNSFRGRPRAKWRQHRFLSR